MLTFLTQFLLVNSSLPLRQFKKFIRHLGNLLTSSSLFNTPTIKRVKTLAHAAEHAIAQNALLTAENPHIFTQNQERTQRKVSGNHLLG